MHCYNHEEGLMFKKEGGGGYVWGLPIEMPAMVGIFMLWSNINPSLYK